MLSRLTDDGARRKPVGPPPTVCEACGKPGRIAHDLFPYLIEYAPQVIHRWLHSGCAKPAGSPEQVSLL